MDSNYDDDECWWCVVVLVVLLTLASLAGVMAQDNIPGIAGIRLGDDVTKTMHFGRIANVDGVVLSSVDNEDKINKIVFIPMTNLIPRTVSTQEYNDMLYEIGDDMKLTNIEVFLTNKVNTIIFNMHEFEVIIKMRGKDDELNITITLKKL